MVQNDPVGISDQSDSIEITLNTASSVWGMEAGCPAACFTASALLVMTCCFRGIPDALFAACPPEVVPFGVE